MGISPALLEYMKVWAVLLSPFLCLATLLTAAGLVALRNLNAYLRMRMGRGRRQAGIDALRGAPLRSGGESGGSPRYPRPSPSEHSSTSHGL